MEGALKLVTSHFSGRMIITMIKYSIEAQTKIDGCRVTSGNVTSGSVTSGTINPPLSLPGGARTILNAGVRHEGSGAHHDTCPRDEGEGAN